MGYNAKISGMETKHLTTFDYCKCIIEIHETKLKEKVLVDKFKTANLVKKILI